MLQSPSDDSDLPSTRASPAYRTHWRQAGQEADRPARSSRRPGPRASHPLDAWTPRPWVTVEQRVAAGRAARQNAPRSSQAALELPADRDPIAILAAQEADRLPGARPASACAHGRVGVRLLPGHARPSWPPTSRRRPGAASSSRPAATPTCRTSGCSPRPSGSWSSMPTTSTRRSRAPGSGTSSGWPSASLIAGRSNGLHAGRGPCTRCSPPSAATAKRRPVRRDAPARHLVLPHITETTSVADMLTRWPAHQGRRAEAGEGPGRCHLRQGARQGRHPRRRQR